MRRECDEVTLRLETLAGLVEANRGELVVTENMRREVIPLWAIAKPCSRAPLRMHDEDCGADGVYGSGNETVVITNSTYDTKRYVSLTSYCGATEKGKARDYTACAMVIERLLARFVHWLVGERITPWEIRKSTICILNACVNIQWVLRVENK
jgi:hypothetical protein